MSSLIPRRGERAVFFATWLFAVSLGVALRGVGVPILARVVITIVAVVSARLLWDEAVRPAIWPNSKKEPS